MSGKLLYNLSPLLQSKMDAKGWSVYKLADECGIPRQRMYDNFKGQNVMSVATFLKIVEALKLKDKDAMKILKELQARFEEYNGQK